jgi:basic membrane protein A
MKKLLAYFLLLVFMSTLFLGCSQNTNEGANNNKKDVLKVALILSGPINDGGWNSIAYNGLKAIEKAYGAEINVAENVPVSDNEERYRAYATEGYDIIIGHGFQYGDVAKKIAKDFPDVKFLVTSTNIYQEPNVSSLSDSTLQVGYLAGIVAGMNTKSNKLFCIGSIEMPPIVETFKGFVKGVKAANPNAQVEIAFVGSQDDAAKAKEMTKAFLEKGFDMGTINADNSGLGVFDALKEQNTAKIVGIVSNYNEQYPEQVLASSTSDYSTAMVYAVGEMIKENSKPQFYHVGIKENVINFYPNTKLLDEKTQKAVDKVISDIKDGSLDVTK